MKNLQVHTRHQENGVPFVGMRSHVFDKLRSAWERSMWGTGYHNRGPSTFLR